MWTAVGVWRWRRNPLRRRTDLFEAWLALAAAVCVLVVAPAVGWLAGARVDDTLQRAVHEQRQERYLVPAVVLRPTQAAPEGGVAADKSAGPQTPQRTRILASWTAPDGSVHRGTVPAAEEPPRAGDQFRIWTDTSGRLVGQPLAASAASFHAVMAGLAAALGVAALVETVRRLIVRRLMHRRYIRLDRAWAAVGPDWGRADAGS
ncbi:hypothetical protein [Streptomyces sp. NPDC046161]|uniref:Rv1733c family protein n=1 Tax=Streptomyces sp. NPDC046161 TaxID=3155132 RepID=UPI0033ECF1F4